MPESALQHRPDPVLLPQASACVQDKAGGELDRIAEAIINASTGGDHRPVASSEEGGEVGPIEWQGGKGTVVGSWEYFC